jgi:DNA-binding MarR family transcriptional regulator
MRLSRRLRQERPDDQLTLSQLTVLGNLSLQGSLTPGELAELEHVRPPTMSRIVAALESDGWVTRQDHPTDGRQCLIVLTQQAVDWIEKYREVRDSWLRSRMEELTSEERDTLLAAVPVLERLAEPDARSRL